MKKAQQLAIKAEKAENEVYSYISEHYPNIDLQELLSNADNASNVNEAISCYIAYGEYNPNDIYEELVNPLTEETWIKNNEYNINAD